VACAAPGTAAMAAKAAVATAASVWRKDVRCIMVGSLLDDMAQPFCPRILTVWVALKIVDFGMPFDTKSFLWQR
jgi:hypothetical protein